MTGRSRWFRTQVSGSMGIFSSLKRDYEVKTVLADVNAQIEDSGMTLEWKKWFEALCWTVVEGVVHASGQIYVNGHVHWGLLISTAGMFFIGYLRVTALPAGNPWDGITDRRATQRQPASGGSTTSLTAPN